MARLLVVDDEAGVRKGLAAFLRLAGHYVAEAGGVREGVERLEDLRPDAMISDLRMEDGSGLELAARAKGILPDLKVILLTGYLEEREGGPETAETVDLVLEKPARPTAVREALGRLLGRERPSPGGARPAEAEPGPAAEGTAAVRREERRLLWGEREDH